MADSCINCRFSAQKNDLTLVCRRYPPRATYTEQGTPERRVRNWNVSIFPVTEHHIWCGEYQRAEPQLHIVRDDLLKQP